MIEQLETRRHLSATLSGNVLTIVGTDRGDDIAIAAGRRQFVVHDNGVQTAFDLGAVKTIRIYGLRGDDSIIVSPNLPIRASIDAGPGNDRVGGGARNDTIFGGHGNDTIAGNDGDDYIDAGPGDDFADGGKGVSVIHGGGGNDRATSGSFLLGSGVEDKSYGFTTDLVRGGSGVLLIVRGPALLGDEHDLGPLSDLPDGTRNVTHRFVEVVNGANSPYTFEVSRDVTDGMHGGFRFTYVNVVDSQQNFSVPFLLPAR